MVFGPWQDELERVLGISGQRRPGQGDRSNREQASLNRQGRTPARGGQSAHNLPDTGLDISMRHGFSASEVNARLAEAGVEGHATFERGPRYGEGTAPHIHVDRRGRRTRSRGSGGTQVAARTPAARTRPIREISADELLGSVLAEDGREIAADQGRHPLVNPYEVEDEARERAGRVNQALEAQDKFLTHFDETIAGVQDRRRERVETNVETRRGINQTVQDETRGMIERVSPILQQRAATAQQLERLAGMNPLERGLRGTFDLNYNQGYLTRRLADFDAVLQATGNDYQYLTSLRERLMTTVNTADANESQLEQLDITELDEEGRSINLSLQAANQSFAFLGDVVNQNENLVRAQIATTDRFLSEQTTTDLVALEGQARQAEGGRVVIDGVELSLGEIRARRMGAEAQDMAFESQRLALRAGEQEVADRAATMWARNATRAQIETAINNGGVAANGMRIPQDVLTAQLGDRMQRQELVAAGSQVGDPVRNLGQNLRSFSREIQTVGGRAQSMFGAMPPEFSAAARTYAQEAQGIAQRIQAANAQGRPEIAQALSQRLEAMRGQFMTRINEVATRHAGGNASVAGWIRSYLTGSDIDAGQAADAMAYYAQRGSLPAGMRASPQARAAFQAARSAIAGVDREIGNRRVSDTERQRMYREEIQRVAPGAYNGNSFNILMNQIPGLAARMQDPFAGVRAQDFQAAASASNSVPFQEIGRSLGISSNDARLLFSGDGSGYRGQDRATLLQRIQTENLRGHLVARQQQVFIEHLDASPSANRDFRPSHALAEFLQRPELYRAAGNMEMIGRNTSYGDFLVSGMTQGSLPERFQQWSDRFQAQVADNTVAETASDRTSYSLWRNNPGLYSRTILAATPGLNQHDEARLMAVIERDPNNAPRMSDAVATIPGLSGIGGARDRARAMIVGQRFQDPELERIRRIAAENWDAVAAQTEAAVEAYRGRR